MAKKLSAIALSKQSPRLPIEAVIPASRSRLPEGEARVLAPLVRVVDDPGGPASPERHFDRFDDQLGAEMLGHRPADDAPTVGIEHHREIEEARPRRDIGDVRDPEPIGSGGGELALDEVRRRRHLGAAPRRARPLAAVAALQPGEPKQARDPLAGAADALVAQFGMDARRAVACPALRSWIVRICAVST